MKKSFGHKYDFTKIPKDICYPNIKGKYFTNKIGALINVVRDSVIMINLYKLLNNNKYTHILMPYGMNHIYSHFNVLKNNFPNITIIN